MLHTRTIDIGVFEQRPNEILLRKDLLDRQIVDIDGRKVVRVNDLRLDEIEGRAAPRRGRCRGRRPGAPYGLRAPVPDHRRGRSAAPCQSATSTGRTSIRSSRPSRRSSCGCPTRDSPSSIRQTWPDILDQLAPPDRAGVLASLDDETVADAMEEMEPEAQVDVMEDLHPARAADILEEMSPDDAADLVADLDQDTRDEILPHMERDEAEEVQELLGYPEDSAGGIMTTQYIALAEHLTVAEAIDRLRQLEPEAETIYYVYVTDDDGRLTGVLSLRDLIVAQPDTPISEVMIREPVAVGVDAPPGRRLQRSSPTTTCWPSRSSTMTATWWASSRSTTRSTPSSPPPGRSACRGSSAD